jgi:hypothetical protein
MLAFGWASHAGFAARASSTFVGVIGLGSLAALAGRRRGQLLLPPARLGESAPTAIVCALAAGAALLPVILYNGYNIFNDTWAYVTVGEWLQKNGFGKPYADDPDYPAYRAVLVYQVPGLRMGATFLLAMTQVVFPAFRTVELFPATVAWALVLNVLGIFLVCRWTLRLPRSLANGAALFAVATIGPLHYSAHNGYYPQLIGTALLLTIIACLSRALAKSNWRFESAFVLGLLAAGLLSSYSEMIPIIVILGGGFVMVGLWLAFRTRKVAQFLRFWGAMLAVFLLLGNIEFLRAARAIPLQMKVVAGGHIPWSSLEFWTAAMGIDVFRGPNPGASLPKAVAAVLLSVAFVLGMGELLRRRRALMLALAIGLLSSMAAYFQFVATNPWTGGTGHSWSLLKVVKWSYPLLVTVQFAGIHSIIRFLPRKEILIAVASLLGLIWISPDHVKIAEQDATPLRQFVDSDEPFVRIRVINRFIKMKSIRRIYLLHEPPGVFPRVYTPYFLKHIAFKNDWGDSWLSHPNDSGRSFAIDPQTSFLHLGPLPFDAADQRVPGGWSLVNPRRSFILNIDNPNYGLQANETGRFFWLGQVKTRMYVFAPHEGDYRLSFRATTGPGLPETSDRRIKITGPGRDDYDLQLHDTTSQPAITVHLRAGISCLEIRCVDRPTHPQPEILEGGIPVSLLVHVSQVKLTRVVDIASDPVPTLR